MSGTTEQQPPPPPKPSHSSQGATIIGRQPGQQPSYPQTPTSQMPGALPGISGTPAPQSSPPWQLATDDQPPGAYGTPDALPYDSTQQPSSSTKTTFVETGPKRARRFPSVIVALIIIIVGLAGFAAFKAGWLEVPLSKAQGFVSGIKLPQWLPIGTKDTTPPVISEVKVPDITEAGAVVTWQTDEPATSQVMICDPAGSCTWTEPDENLVTTHSVSLSDLKPDTTYKITASSMDARENQQTYEGKFTTLSGAATTQLQISGVSTSQITDSSAIVNWVTDKPATSQVEYETTDAYGSTTQLDENLTASHSVTLDSLKPNTIYHFSVKSKDASGNEASSQDQTFTTNSTAPVTAEIGPEKGKLAPDFTLQGLDGKMISLSDFRGKIVMINFWTSRIQCRNQLSFIEEVYKKWPQKDQLEILAINVGESDKDAQKVVNELGLTFTVLLDKDQKVAKTYEVTSTSTPASFFIDTQGIIEYTVSNRLSGVPEIQDKLNSLQSPP